MIAVTIIAFFFPSPLLPNATVATTGRATAVGAGVRIDFIAIVTDFAHFSLNFTVSATQGFAGVRAAVLIVVVGIVAFFIALFLLAEVGAQRTIAAARRLAIGEASVAIEVVTIVAALGTDDARA